MQRRDFIKGATATAVTLALFGCSDADNSATSLTIDATIKKLNGLRNKKIKYSGEWSPAQIFNHCAQSIEFSMLGYPEHKSTLFKETIGSLAFWWFSSQQSMSHDLAEAIPGAEPLMMNADLSQALSRCILALNVFKRFSEPLQPHFAYGELSHKEYALAHVIHIENHFEELTLKAS